MKASENNTKYAAPVLIGLAAAYFLFGGKEDSKKGIKTAEAELKNDTTKASYTLVSYSNLADNLQAAMVDVGTNEDKIYSVFKKLKTPKDLLLLIKAFGTREYFNFGIRQGNYNLAQWLNIELNESEISEVNSILQKSNINFAF